MSQQHDHHDHTYLHAHGIAHSHGHVHENQKAVVNRLARAIRRCGLFRGADPAGRCSLRTGQHRQGDLKGSYAPLYGRCRGRGR